MYLNDIHLEELVDVTDLLEFPELAIVSERDMEEFIETSMMLMSEYIEHHPPGIFDDDFIEKMLEDVKELQYEEWLDMDTDMDMDMDIDMDELEDDLDYLLECALTLFMDTFYPETTIGKTTITIDKNDNTMITKEDTKPTLDTLMRIDKIAEKIHILKNIPQPSQRTKEWYEFRHNLITASNAWKAFGTQASVNQLIYEKCHPIDVDSMSSRQFINIEGSLHWGQKYEPMSVMLYEEMYQTKVEEFGCIPHAKYPFLGASPDGIVVDKKSSRFGRMLEIKNPISRVITGVPKKEYWIQIQIQMEVCDLDECDFLETKFVEYDNDAHFMSDVYIDIYTDNTDNTEENLCLSKDKKPKGKMMCFQSPEGVPIYVYKPLHLVTFKEIEEWEHDTINQYEREHEFIKIICWKLDALSCITIPRNREWFENSIAVLENVWKMIEQERITGYDHRKANKREKGEKANKQFDNKEGICLLKVIE